MIRLLFLIFVFIFSTASFSSQKLNGIERFLSKNVKIVYKDTNQIRFIINPKMIIVFEDTAITIKVGKGKSVHPFLSLYFFSISQKSILQKEINNLQQKSNLVIYEELQDYLILANKRELGYSCPGIDCLLFRRSIKNALYDYYKIDKPIEPGYGNK